MKLLFLGLLSLFSLSAFAQDSLRLTLPDSSGFGTDVSVIPSDDGSSAEQSFRELANVLSEDVCYVGNPANVKLSLDSLALSASNVRKYQSKVSGKVLFIKLTIFNRNVRSNQDASLEVEECTK